MTQLSAPVLMSCSRRRRCQMTSDDVSDGNGDVSGDHCEERISKGNRLIKPNNDRSFCISCTFMLLPPAPWPTFPPMPDSPAPWSTFPPLPHALLVPWSTFPPRLHASPAPWPTFPPPPAHRASHLHRRLHSRLTSSAAHIFASPAPYGLPYIFASPAPSPTFPPHLHLGLHFRLTCTLASRRTSHTRMVRVSPDANSVAVACCHSMTSPAAVVDGSTSASAGHAVSSWASCGVVPSWT